MKKVFALLAMLSTSLVYANDTNSTPPPPPPGGPQMSKECKPVMDHMRKSHEQIEKLIQENKATDIGNIIIADHKYLEQYPQCRPPLPPRPQQ